MTPPSLPAIFEARRSPKRSTINIHSRAAEELDFQRQFLCFFRPAHSVAEHVERCLRLLIHQNGTNHTVFIPLIILSLPTISSLPLRLSLGIILHHG